MIVGTGVAIGGPHRERVDRRRRDGPRGARVRAVLKSRTLFAIAVFIWGIADGRADARDNPDPDRRADLAMTWLLAGLFAGVVSGLVAWFISLFYKSLYVESLLNEVTTFAAFTALVLFLFSVAGVALGRWLVDRKAPVAPHHGTSVTDDERADTDVFAAVRHDGGAAEPAPTEARREE